MLEPGDQFRRLRQACRSSRRATITSITPLRYRSTTSGKGIHRTGAVYDAEAPKGDMSLPTGQWNHMKITCRGKNFQIELNGKPVVDWQAEPRGKVRDFLLEGYIGLQNHDSLSPVYFRDIFIKGL